MKRLLLLSLLLPSLWASAGTIRLTTTKEPGTKVKILLNAASATTPVTIDWGNGIEMKYTVDPKQMAYNRWIEGTIEGSELSISGNVTEASLQELNLTAVEVDGMNYLKDLDLSKNDIVTFELMSTTPLEDLNLSHNKLVNSTQVARTLSLEYAGETLTNLNVSYNEGLICLDIRDLTSLEYFTANDCPVMGSVFICMPEDSRAALKQINLSNCDLAHFYPVSLPNLTSLNLRNNALMTAADTDPFVLGNYPSLRVLDIADNGQIDYLDITQCKKLTSLNISNNQFERIDLSQAPELEVLYAANNHIPSFDIGANKSLRVLDVSGNPVTDLDISNYRSITSLNISNTRIARVNLMNLSYLTEFNGANTLLEFVDFNGQQAQRMNKIDLSNNPNMTGETVDYTLHTLPEGKGSGGVNLFLSGSNAETANTAYATSSDMKWKCDVTGDGSATHKNVSVTLKDATDTGENKTGVVDRLYPIFGMSMDYDFDIYETTGGKFLISQWQPVYFQKMNGIVDKALTGVPIHIYPYPEEGKRFKSVTVNGKEIKDQWFVITEDSEITVNFTNNENSFSFTTNPGQAVSMLVNTLESNGTVSVDWGTGTRTEYTGQNKYTSGYAEIKGSRIDGTAAGNGTVTIYGDLAAVDLSGFGEYGLAMGLWDNQVKSVDLTNAPDLKYLNVYWNPVKELNLSGAEGLEVLNVGYTAVKDLSLDNCPNLMYLDAHGDGFGDEEEGMALLSSIDVTKLPILQYLNVKGNELTSIDLSQNPYLTWLYVTNNDLTSLDVTANTNLEELEAGHNQLTSIDLSKNSKLVSLSLSGNKLTTLDLSNNPVLGYLYIEDNDIHALDLSKQAVMRRIAINGNGMTADELNDFYYLLPQRQHGADDDDPNNKINWNLQLIQGTDKVQNDALRADSSIAEDRGWTPSHLGSNGGSEFAYLDILTSAHGKAVVKGEDGTEYTHGSKVPKYSKVTIETTTDEGYVMKHFTLNGEEQQEGNSFDMPGIYTKLRVEFGKGSGVEDITSASSIFATDGGVIVIADNATVDIISMDGKVVVSSAAVAGNAFFSLENGMYIVRKAEAGKTDAVKVMVK